MKARVPVLSAIEDFLYEVCLLVVFYPWFLARLVFRPGRTLEEYRDSIARAADEQEQSDELMVSPPVFLFISAAIIALFFPAVDLGSLKLFSNVARLVSTDATISKIAAICVPALLLAINAALVIEWRTPGGVTRKSFHMPLMMSILVASVFTMVTATILALVSVADKDNDLGAVLLSLLLVIGGAAWFLFAQAKVFRLLTPVSKWAAVGYSLLVIGIDQVVSLLLPQG